MKVPRDVIKMLHAQALSRFTRMQTELENDKSNEDIEPEEVRSFRLLLRVRFQKTLSQPRHLRVLAGANV